MKFVSALGLTIVVTACGGDPFDSRRTQDDPLHDRPAYPRWVEWPAAVRANQSISVRVVVEPRCLDARLILWQSVQGTSLLVTGEWVDLQSLSAVCDSLETRNVFSTLAPLTIAGPPRALTVHTSTTAGTPGFGILRVVADSQPNDTIRAAGAAMLFELPAGCTRIMPGSGDDNAMSYPLEGTSEAKFGAPFWAEGYLRRGTTACQAGPADTLVFHLTAERFQPWGPPD